MNSSPPASIPTPPATTLSTPSPTERVNPVEDADLTMSSSKFKPIYLIVATSINPPLGIGLRNNLPWPPVRSDMSFFMKVTRDSRPSFTSRPSDPPTMNAVLMGRKTWDSIPAKFRPLTGRLNVVISRTEPVSVAGGISEEMNQRGMNVEVRTLDEPKAAVVTSSSVASATATAPVLVAESLDTAISHLSSTTASLPAIGNVFCIGGAEIYRMLLAHTQTRSSADNTPAQVLPVRVLLTQIRRLDNSPFECDTFFPVSLGLGPNSAPGWRQVQSTELKKWIAGTDLPQGDDADGTNWKKDEKAGVEIRVSGWERDS